jgi:hypothetical protein
MLGRPYLAVCSLAAALVMATARGAQAQSAPASASAAPAPAARPIAAVTAFEGTDTVVTIAGRSSVNAGQLQENVFDVAIQDATGGIRIFSKALDKMPKPPVREGDSLVATGTIRRYRGDLELVATQVAVVPGPPRPILPREVPIDVTTMSRYPGQLVRIHGRVTGFGTRDDHRLGTREPRRSGRPRARAVRRQPDREWDRHVVSGQHRRPGRMAAGSAHRRRRHPLGLG